MQVTQLDKMIVQLFYALSEGTLKQADISRLF